MANAQFISAWNATGAQLVSAWSAGISCGVTGTITTAVESDIVTGGKTIILTLTGDTWVAAGTTFDAQRQGIIDGLLSGQTETTGWNNEVKGKEVVTAVVRTSDTIVTITLSASSAYSVTADETITVTVPNAALVTSTTDITGSPTFTITNEGGSSTWGNSFCGLSAASIGSINGVTIANVNNVNGMV